MATPNLDDINSTFSQSEPQIEESSQRRGKRKVARTSPVWNFFDLVIMKNEKGVDEERALCKLCKKSYTAKSSSGTGHLDRHLKKCQQQHGVHDPKQSTLNFNTSDGSLTNFHYDHQNARNWHARAIASGQLPINIGEQPWFEEYIKEAYNPSHRKVSRNTTRSDIMKVFYEMRGTLILEFLTFNASISCTSDMWQGRAMNHYICVTGHWLDSTWQVQKRLLGFRRMPYPHDASSIYNAIIEVFDMYNIREKVMSITFDNASANNAAINLFKTTLKPPFGGKFFHKKCACHIINLCVQDGMQQFSNYLDKIRAAISFINSSGARQQDFGQMCKRSGLRPRTFPSDVQHRWNSMYLLLEACLPYKDVISPYYNMRNPQDPISEIDWQVAQCFNSFLKVFYDATCHFSGVYYPTSPHALSKLHDITAQFKLHRNVELFQTTVAFMERKFKKYWQKVPPLYGVAAVMDPRIKLQGVEWLLMEIGSNMCVEELQEQQQQQQDHDNEEAFLNISRVRALLTTMFTSYNETYGSNTGVSSQPIQSPMPNMPWLVGSGAGPFTSSRNELEKYLETDFNAFILSSPDYPSDFFQFDLPGFWKQHARTFPVVSKMARDLLTVPISSVASEQVFSLSGRVIEERRTRLNDDIIEALMCLKDWEDARRRKQQNQHEEEDWFEDFGNLDISGTPSVSSSTPTRSNA